MSITQAATAFEINSTSERSVRGNIKILSRTEKYSSNLRREFPRKPLCDKISQGDSLSSPVINTSELSDPSWKHLLTYVQTELSTLNITRVFVFFRFFSVEFPQQFKSLHFLASLHRHTPALAPAG